MKKKVNKGYEVVYDHGGYTLPVGSHVVYPCYWLAAQYRARYEKRPWMEGKNVYIRRVDDYRELSKPEYFNGKIVYPNDWIPNLDCLERGNLVDSEFVSIYANNIDPAVYKPGFFQLGGTPVERLIGDRFYDVYPTFVQLADNVWEYKGYCVKGHSKEVA